MYIREIHVENIRGFGAGEEGVHLDLARPDGSFAGWTVITGVNGAGKTTFLRALALSVSAVSTAIALGESEGGWVRKSARLGYAKALVVRSPGDEFKKSNHAPLRKYPEAFWTGLRWREDPNATPTPMRKLDRFATYAPSEGPCAKDPEGWFIAGYGPFRRIDGSSRAPGGNSARPNRVVRLLSLFREDVSLGECVSWLQELDYRSSAKKGAEARASKQLKSDVIRLLGDGLLPGGATVERVDPDGLWVKREGVSLLHTQLSDGYRAVTALVLDIVKNIYETFGSLDLTEKSGAPQIRHRGVVLIDEIDAHLHISWQKDIGLWLKKHFPGIQFIVTTHSPFICQAADQNGLIRLATPGDPRPAGPVPEDVYYTVVNGSADNAVMTELFGREAPYSDAAEELREEVSNLESLVIRGKATKTQERKLKELESQLPNTPSAEVEKALLKLSAQLGAKAKR